MTDETYTDHDLLIIIAERVRVMGDGISDLRERVTTLERDADRSKGLLSGINWLWSFAVASPGLVALVLRNQ